MDSDVDADVPVRMKSIKKSPPNETKSPFLLPGQQNSIRSQYNISPVSNFSIKSSKDKMDISEIRRILTKLKSEIDQEKKKNRELAENTVRQLDQQKLILEDQHKNEVSQLNDSWNKKYEESLKKNDGQNLEINKLKQKLSEITSNSVKAGTSISNMDDVLVKINEFCNLETHEFSKTEELMKVINDLNQLVKDRIPQQPGEQDLREDKIRKLRNQNAELSNIVRMLDRKLKNSQKEFMELKDDIAKNKEAFEINNENDLDTNNNLNLEMMLKRAISERLMLEKQLVWIKKKDDTNPATRERVEVLTKQLTSFQTNQKLLDHQLFVLREKSNKLENLINENSVLKEENRKLNDKLIENSIVQTNFEKFGVRNEFNKSIDEDESIERESLDNPNNEYQKQMDRLLKYIRETSDKRSELEMEYAAMKALLETKLRNDFTKRDTNSSSSRDEHSEDSTESLKAELRELEKRCTQQALNYEEALLELETLKKTNQRYNLDFYQRNGTKDDLGWLLQLMSNYSKEKNSHNSAGSSIMEDVLSFNNEEFGKVADTYGLKISDRTDSKRETAIFGRSDTNSSNMESEKNYPMDNKNMSPQISNSVSNIREMEEMQNNNGNLTGELETERKHVPAPLLIKIENHPNQKNTRIVRWKSPEMDLTLNKVPISSYHIYIDGHFYKGVSINEPLAAVLPNLDLKRSHRIVIRSVCSQGQSKDAQCTIEIGSFSLAPSNLKANKITGTSAQISWIPSNSNWRHTVWVNGIKYCDCLPGTYKIMMQGLTPDSLQKVQVHPVIDKFVDNVPNSNNCSYLDFQTLPIYNPQFDETKKPTDEIEFPMDVKLKLGNRPGRFIVKWVCPSQVMPPNIKIVGYSIHINNQCIALVNGARNDRFTISLRDLKTINPPPSQNLLNQHDHSYLPLTVRTMATITKTDYDNGVTESTIYSKDSQPVLRFSGHVAARIAGTAAEAAIILGDQLASFLNLMEANSEEKFEERFISRHKMHSSDHDKINDSKACWHSCYCLNNSEFYDNESSFLPRSKLDWMENNPYQYRSMSIHYLDQPRLNNQHRSLSDDSALDRLSDSREMGKDLSSELIDDVCSTESSSNSHNFLYQNADADSSSTHRKSITEHTARGDGDPNKYLVVRHISKQSQSPKNSKEFPQPKISVPKIQITKDSSFSEDDENQTMMSYRNKNRAAMEQYNKITQQQKSASRNYNEFKNRSSISNEEAPTMKSRSYSNSQSERINSQNQWPNNYNSDKINNISNERYNYANHKPVENIRYFVALFDYDPATMSPNSGAIHEELPFKAGQNIKVFGPVDEDGFYTGETNGRRGLVPSNMVSEIETKTKYKSMDNSDISFQERNIVSMDRSKETNLSRSLQGKLNNEYGLDTQQDYQSNQTQYPYNQYPSIHRKSTDSAVSYAASDPNSYQRPPIDNYVPRQSSAGISRNPSEYRKMLALYDYDPQTLSPNVDSDAELAFKCNDIIEIIGEMDEDGFFMGRKNGQRGLVPSNFLTDLPPPLENRLRNQSNYQGSFDNSQIPNQYKERNFSSGMNFSDPPQPRDNRSRSKPFDHERPSLTRTVSNNNDEYVTDRVSHNDSQKNNLSFEESFDSGPPGPRQYVMKPEPKSNNYHCNNAPRMPNHDQVMDNKVMQYPTGVPLNNKMPNRSNKPIADRRSSHDKPIHRAQQPMNLPPRDLSPPPPVEVDDMPIVMDLAPTKDNQKKKKVPSNMDNYRPNVFENQENYGNNESLYVNSNSVMSDNLERKRSVFKNPFKKKKS